MRATNPIFCIGLLLASGAGCASYPTADCANGNYVSPTSSAQPRGGESRGRTGSAAHPRSAASQIELVRYDQPANRSASDEPEPLPETAGDTSLENLVREALEQNPRLSRLDQEYQAAAARVGFANKLPDPKLGANFFGNPIETAAGSQRANMNLSQAIPWPHRLNAVQQQACLEALAVKAELDAQRLRVIAGVRVGLFRLYVVEKQIRTTEANQKFLNALIEAANARIATGKATQGDVLLGTLELSHLEERLLNYRRRRRAVEAEINRLLGRSADTPLQPPERLAVGEPDLDAAEIHQVALSHQPEIEAARLRAEARRWGIEVARLSRRPELMLSANYFFTDDNRPASSIVNVGEDPWSLGVQVSLPIWQRKYDAMREEAEWQHQASHQTVQELHDRYDAMILDLLTEARRAADTARLYQSTILPQARQTLSADQGAYSNGTVEFDRVIRDYRNLLTLELGYQKAVGDLAIANARIQQAAGRDLAFPRELSSE